MKSTITSRVGCLFHSVSTPLKIARSPSGSSSQRALISCWMRLSDSTPPNVKSKQKRSHTAMIRKPWKKSKARLKRSKTNLPNLKKECRWNPVCRCSIAGESKGISLTDSPRRRQRPDRRDHKLNSATSKAVCLLHRLAQWSLDRVSVPRRGQLPPFRAIQLH